MARTVGRSFRQLSLLRGSIRSLPFKAARVDVAAFVTSQVVRFSSIWTAWRPFSTSLICIWKKNDHVTSLLRDYLHWLPVPLRVESACSWLSHFMESSLIIYATTV